MLGPVGASGDVGVSEVYSGAGRNCRYSGTRRGIGGIRGICKLLRGFGPLGHIRGVGCVRGVLEGWQECRYSGARRNIGGIWGLLGVLGVLGH